MGELTPETIARAKAINEFDTFSKGPCSRKKEMPSKNSPCLKVNRILMYLMLL